MSEHMLEVEMLCKNFGSVAAVKDLSFSVPKGEIFGFLGPNGAGKTTTMRMITSFLPASSGTVRIAGLNTQEHDLETRRKIGYLPETTPLYTDMFVDEYIRYVGELRGMTGLDLKKAVEKMLSVCGLHTMRKRPVAYLSKGYRQRVGLAQAMIHEPDLLILDEPMSGLDPNQIVEIRELIKEMGEEKTIIYCSHILSEVAATCNRVLIINNGELAALGTPDEVTAQVQQGCSEYEMVLHGNGKAVIEEIKMLPNIIRVRSQASDVGTEGIHIFIESSAQTDIGELLFTTVVKHNCTLSKLIHHRTTLEDVFTQLTLTRKDVK